MIVLAVPEPVTGIQLKASFSEVKNPNTLGRRYHLTSINKWSDSRRLKEGVADRHPLLYKKKLVALKNPVFNPKKNTSQKNRLSVSPLYNLLGRTVSFFPVKRVSDRLNSIPDLSYSSPHTFLSIPLLS